MVRHGSSVQVAYHCLGSSHNPGIRIVCLPVVCWSCVVLCFDGLRWLQALPPLHGSTLEIVPLAIVIDIVQ